MTGKPNRAIDYHNIDDLELAALAADRDPQAVRTITTRNNQRLFRVAWGILRNRTEAEDAVQSAYLRAFSSLDKFQGRSALSTWLTRIVINEALGAKRARERQRQMLETNEVAVLDLYREELMQGSLDRASNGEQVARIQIRGILERAIAALPQEFRLVFILREVEGLSVKDTADALGLVEGTVKTRLHRARLRLKEMLAPEVRDLLHGTFPFAGPDCDRMTNAVVAEVCVSVSRKSQANRKNPTPARTPGNL